MKTIKKYKIAIAGFVGLCVIIRFTPPVDSHIRYAASSAAGSGDMMKLRLTRLLGVDIYEPVPGRGPLLVSAAWNGQQEIIEYLLNAGVNIETKDKFGGTALSRASQEGQIETVRMLIQRGADVNTQDMEGGNTPLDLCRMNAVNIGFDPSPIIDLLVKNGGKAITSK